MSAAGTVDAAAILARGHYAILDDYALREELGRVLHAAFHDGIERHAGRACRSAIESEGLSSLHRHFPAAKVRLLEDYVFRRARNDLYRWSCAVGVTNLGLAHPFYIDHLAVIRIHYPYRIARAGGATLRPTVPIAEWLRMGAAVARDPRLLVHQVAKHYRTRARRRERRLLYDPASYHGEMPTGARAHGPHIDTWYGHSYDGINLWLSIDGVDEDNTVILYPEMFGKAVACDPKSMYLAAGIALPRPTKVLLAPGQLLLFNPEMLHGTQVNISERTRVALTTRINPRVPRFNDDAPFNFEHWYLSSDVERGRFGRIKLYAAHVNRGAPSVAQCDPTPDPRLRRITVAEPMPATHELPLAASGALGDGDALAVTGPDFSLLLVRTAEGVRAYDRRCPHRGVDIADGSREGGLIFCPGHGVAFSAADGTSKCPAFTLRRLDVAERDGQILLLPRKRSSAIDGAR